MNEPRVFASVLLLLVGFAESMGIERARAFEVAGVSPADVEDLDALVPYESLIAIWQELLERFPSAPLGLRYASMWSVDGLGIVGYVLRHARDGHHAIALTERLTRLVDPYLRIEIERRADAHVVRLDHEPRVVAMVEPLEMLVLALVHIALSLVRDDARPTAVCFRHDARHPVTLYAELVGRDVPVRFGAPFNGVIFPSALLDLPLRDADPRMASYLVRHAEALLQEVQAVDAPLEERVRHAISTALASGDVEAPAIAKTLGVSVRTLQRELQGRGTSFSNEVDLARKGRALTLLRRPELTVAEVAFMLGYSDARVFHRSFRRWTGTTPTDFRRRPK